MGQGVTKRHPVLVGTAKAAAVLALLIAAFLTLRDKLPSVTAVRAALIDADTS